MTTCYAVGNSIDGERIACQYRSIRIEPPASATHSHPAGRAVLRDAYCIIERQIRAL